MRNLAAILAGAAISLAAPIAVMAEAPGFVFSQDKLEWKAGPPELPRGAEVAMLFGDPMREADLTSCACARRRDIKLDRISTAGWKR